MRSRILATGLTLGCQLATALPSAAATANPSLLYTQTTLFPPAPSNLASSSGQPSGITVDTSGNLYLADFPGGQVLKTQPGSTGPAEVAASGIIVTGGKALAGNLALDASGNLYLMEITDSDKNTCSVIRIPANAPASHTELFHGVPNPSALWVAPDGKTILVGGDDAYRFTSSDGNQFGPNALDDARLKAHTPFYNTQGIAQDPAGNIYLTHGTATAPDDATVVSRVTPGGTVTHLATVNTDGTVTPAAAPITPDSRFGGVATDSQGNVFVADHDHILELSPTQAGSWACAFLGAGMANAPGQLVVPSPGSVVDFDGSTVTQFSFPGSFSLGSSPVGGGGGGVIQFPGGPGGTPAGQTLTVSFSSDGGAPTVTTLTGGTPGTGLDFQVTPLKPPPSGYAAGETDTLTVTFAPTAAGARNGALVLGDASGNPLVTTYLSGIGTGGLPGLLPGQAAQVPYSADSPAMGVAVDGSGNLYLADPVLPQVQKVAPDGTTAGVGSASPGKPSGVAVDGAGNVFYTSPTSGKVIRETPLGNGQWQQTLVDSGLPSPFGLAVDGAGNVFVADTTAGALYRETPTLGGYQRSTVDSALKSPSYVAVDGAGNLYVQSSDGIQSQIWQEAPGPAGYGQNPVDNRIPVLFGLAVDIAGALLVATDNTVVREVPDPSGFIHQVLAVPGLVSAGGLAVDPAGNLYVTDRSPFTITGNSRFTVWKLDFSAEQSLVFGETQAGARSFDSPQSVTLQNLGNDDLTFSAPLGSGGGSGGGFGGPGGGNLPASNPQFTGPDFQWDPASSFPLLVTDPVTGTRPTFTLPSLATATMDFDFAPTVAGSHTEAAIFRVRANGSIAQRQVNLIGQATLGLSPAALSADYIGVAFAQTLSGVGGTPPYSFHAASGLPGGLSLDSHGNLQGTPPAPGSFSFNVPITDSANLTGSPVCTLTVPPVVKITVADATVTYDGLPHGLTATPSATVTGSLAFAFTGQKTHYSSSDPPTQADTYTVTVTLVNDPVLSGSGQGTLTISQATAGITPPDPAKPVTATYDGLPHGIAFTLSPAGQITGSLSYAYVGSRPGNTSTTAPVLADTYTVTATLKDDPNFTGSGTGTLIISPATASFTVPPPTTVTYDGKPHAFPITVAPLPPPALPIQGQLAFTYKGKTTPYSSSDPPTQADSYTVTATLKDDPNYAGSGTGTLTIAKASVSLDLAPLNPVYNAQPVQVTAQPTPATPVPNVTITYSSPSVPELPGSYQVIATLADSNFVLANPDDASGTRIIRTLIIGQAQATIDVPDLTFTYDGNPHELQAKVSGASTSTPVQLPAAFSYHNTGKDVTYDSDFPPSGAGQYQVAATLQNDPIYAGKGQGTLTIKPAGFNFEMQFPDQPYTGLPVQVTPLAHPAAPAPPFHVDYSGGTPPIQPKTLPILPGTYQVTATLLDTQNFQLLNPDVKDGSTATGNLVIQQAPAAIAVPDLTVTYDGQPHKAAYTITPSTGTQVSNLPVPVYTGIDVAYPASTTAPSAAGHYSVKVALAGDPVYQGAGSGTLTINKAPVSLTWSATTFTYDGTPHAVTASVNLPPNTTAATLPTATVSYNGGSTAPTAATGPSGLPVLATLVDPTGNFSLDPGLANNTEVINPARATITLSGNLEPTYTGKPQPLTASVVTTFSPPPAATVTYDGATTPPTGAGTYAVTATLADPDFQATPASATLTIDPAPVSLALGPLNQAYSGSPRTVTARPDPASPMPQVQVSYSGGTAPTLPGSYQVAARLADRNFVLTNPTFAGIPVVTGILTVTRTTAKVAVPSGSFTYDGQPHGLTASIEPTTGTPVTGTPGYAYTGVDVTYAGATPPAAPGRYQVDVTLDGDPVYLGSGTGTLTIRPATVRLALSGLDQCYTGGPRPVTVVATPPTPRPRVQVTYGSGAAASSTAPSQPGSYPVTVRLADPDFVPIPDVTGTLTIGRGVSLALTGLSQAYDGSPRPVTVVATPAIPMSQIKVSYDSGSAATRNPPTEPGSYPVAAELNGPGLVLLDPSVPGGHQVTGTLTITQARATVTFDKATLAQPYTGKPRTVTASVTPIAPLILTYQGNNVDYPTSLSAPTKPGDYQVIATVVSRRYVGSAIGTLTVDGTVKVFLWGLDRRATGKPITVRATTSAPVQAVKVTYEGSPTPPARPGKYTVRATVVDPVLKGSAFGTLIID